MSAQAQTFGFETEAKQLLKLMIHSLYSNREVFLRELISNASDAIDRLRFQAISKPELVGEDNDFAIRVAFDKEAKTLTVADNGIGMSRQEVIDNLGTIARSGTAEFLSQLSGDQKKDATLIGQFGVGFYSAFIVAEEVEVLTRAADAEAGVRWVSQGEDEYSVAEAEAERGTQVTLRLRDDALEFADGFRLRNLVRKYSDHISVPVRMVKETPAGDDDDGKAAEAPEWESVNEATALWTRSRSEISDEEYREFYKHVSHDFEDPLSWSHNRVEGRLEYTSLLYLPKRAPFDLWNRESPRGLKLYVQRVFIMDDADQFLPLYLRFVKGVVDSSDLPLNVSREVLQQDERVASIRSALTKRVLTTLDGMAKKEAEDYQTFWDEFGEVIKEGAGDEFANRELYSGLLRFASTAGEDAAKNVGLKDYLERLVEDQDRIYYLVAESYENARSSPHLEIFRERGIEVLLLFDRIDEWLMSNLPEFDGKAFQDITRAGLVLPGEAGDKTAEGEDSQKDASKDESDDDPLADRIKAALGDRVEAVRASTRLTDSPACLVQGEFALGRQMQRIMEATGQAFTPPKPSFEYNAEHPLLKRLDQESDEDRFAELVLVLFDQASLAEGDALQDAGAYVNRMNRLLLELLER
ncbi:MAG: molecular chaperone HtpG [Gammaproteobacteria bacterium]|nr:molecular chaperone HtpG [Gammaproteobacteria bacterium]MYE51604.1 molecular chaperone HtpG [Gammaproteobacteria bacterium]MYF48738.1 molecular chaperone HtpG [Gammaproteobacteria bacterium]